MIDDKELCKQLDVQIDDNGNTLFTDASGVFHKLPVDVQELGLRFLQRLQKLHDDVFKQYWDDKGITEKGLSLINEIKHEFNLEVVD